MPVLDFWLSVTPKFSIWLHTMGYTKRSTGRFNNNPSNILDFDKDKIQNFHLQVDQNQGWWSQPVHHLRRNWLYAPKYTVRSCLLLRSYWCYSFDFCFPALQSQFGSSNVWSPSSPYRVTIPFSQVGISIARVISYVKIEAKLGLVVMWNEKDSLWVCLFVLSSSCTYVPTMSKCCFVPLFLLTSLVLQLF